MKIRPILLVAGCAVLSLGFPSARADEGAKEPEKFEFKLNVKAGDVYWYRQTMNQSTQNPQMGEMKSETVTDSSYAIKTVTEDGTIADIRFGRIRGKFDGP